MYQVSEAYKAAIAKEDRDFYYEAVLLTNDGRSITVSETDMVKGSAVITSQCCGNDEIEIGSVYASEFDISIYTNIDRYALYGGSITPSFYLKIENGNYERVPLGIYEIAEAERGISSIDITAYDYITRFEKDFALGQTSGSAYDLLNYACAECGVAMGCTKNEIERMPNGREALSLYPDNDIATWRDLLHYLSQVLCGFCMIDRSGQLVIRKYDNKTVKQIADRQRFKSSFADYITRYTGLKHTNTKNNELDYVNVEPDDGLTMTLEANPLLQQNTKQDRDRVLNSILSDLQTIKYVPFDSESIEDPALDLGDILMFSEQHADSSGITCITHNALTFNGRQSLQCVGKNPRLMGVKSKTDKRLTSLQNTVNNRSMTMYHYTNGKVLSVGQTKIEAVDLQFVSTKEANAEFQAVLLLDVVTAGTLEVKYILYDMEITDFYPRQTLTEGKHIVNLYYPITDIPENKVGTMRVILSMGAGGATIDRGGLRATITGQGFAAGDGKWDGNIKIEQTIKTMPTGISWVDYLAGVTVNQKTPREGDLADTIPTIGHGINLIGFADEITESEVIKSQTITIFSESSLSNQYVTYDGETTRLQTAYRYMSEAQTIDTGYLCRVTVNTEQFKRIDGIEVRHSGL